MGRVTTALLVFLIGSSSMCGGPPILIHEPADAVYDRRRSMEAYARRAYPLYRRFHVQRAMAMVLKAIGLNSTGRLNGWLTRVGLWFLRRRVARLEAQGA